MPAHGAGPGAEDSEDPAAVRLAQRLTQALDLPPEIVFDLSRITIVGGLQMTIENHRGLLEFSPTRVTVATSRGTVVVTGEDLRIGVVHEQEITVAGQLRSIGFAV